MLENIWINREENPSGRQAKKWPYVDGYVSKKGRLDESTGYGQLNDGCPEASEKAPGTDSPISTKKRIKVSLASQRTALLRAFWP